MNDSDPVVVARDLGKRYVKYDDVPTLIAGFKRLRIRARRQRFWAVRHVDLEVARGEAVGVIGRNGAGKSTMLAMLAGVTSPTEGRLSVRGRVAPLLRLGVGFHEELTGRENVHITGTILGLTDTEIDRLFDDIVAFAGLEQFIDTPVKFYSSGMEARLGFSVAVMSHPDLLIVDEALAVGDLEFQIRSFERMVELQKRGTGILVVSHNVEAIRRLCSKVLVLHKGAPRFLGPSTDAVAFYHELLSVEGDDHSHDADGGAQRAAPMRILGVDLLDDAGSPVASVESGSRVKLRIAVGFDMRVVDPLVGVWVTNESSHLVFADNAEGQPTGTFDAGAQANFDIDMTLPLVNGMYALRSWIAWSVRKEDQLTAPVRRLYVSSRHKLRGVADLSTMFSVREITGDETGVEAAPVETGGAEDPSST